MGIFVIKTPDANSSPIVIERRPLCPRISSKNTSGVLPPQSGEVQFFGVLHLPLIFKTRDSPLKLGEPFYGRKNFTPPATCI